jgi:hypothetical protein
VGKVHTWGVWGVCVPRLRGSSPVHPHDHKSAQVQGVVVVVVVVVAVVVVKERVGEMGMPQGGAVPALAGCQQGRSDAQGGTGGHEGVAVRRHHHAPTALGGQETGKHGRGPAGLPTLQQQLGVLVDGRSVLRGCSREV